VIYRAAFRAKAVGKANTRARISELKSFGPRISDLESSRTWILGLKSCGPSISELKSSNPWRLDLKSSRPRISDLKISGPSSDSKSSYYLPGRVFTLISCDLKRSRLWMLD
jgi:hypothetical protein